MGRIEYEKFESLCEIALNVEFLKYFNMLIKKYKNSKTGFLAKEISGNLKIHLKNLTKEYKKKYKETVNVAFFENIL